MDVVGLYAIWSKERRLKEEYCAAVTVTLFDSLKCLLPDEPGAPSRSEIAFQSGMTDNALRQAFHRFRQRYQSCCAKKSVTPSPSPVMSRISCAN